MIEAQRAKPRTPTPAVDALIGDEEQTGKKKKEQRKKQGMGLQPIYPGPFGRLLPYDPQGLYNKPILVTPPDHRENLNIYINVLIN